MTTATPCIEWQGLRDADGYGRTSVNFAGVWKGRAAHRLAVARLYGWEAIEGFVVMHTCDNPPCVNPEHLRVGTTLANTQDAFAKGRRRATKHGSQRMYNQLKCRCDVCVEASRAYQRQRAAILRDRPESPGVNHNPQHKENTNGTR